MDIKKFFNNKDYRSYDFICVFRQGANLSKCKENIRILFEKHFGPKNVICDWKVTEENNIKKLKGALVTIPKWQHRFRKRVDSHDCGDFFIRVA